ncbi:hypothetical protein D9M71_593040 [compost metagenome]
MLERQVQGLAIAVAAIAGVITGAQATGNLWVIPRTGDVDAFALLVKVADGLSDARVPLRCLQHRVGKAQPFAIGDRGHADGGAGGHRFGRIA